MTPPSGLPAFALQSETTTLAAAMTAAGTTPTARRQYMIDRWIRKLKDAGVWAKLVELNIVSEADAVSRINWKSPGTRDLAVTGGPLFNAPTCPVGSLSPANSGYRSFSTTKYLESGQALNGLTPGNFTWGVLCNVSANDANFFAGALDGGNGLAIAPITATGMMVRAMGATITVGANADTNGVGVFAINSNASTSFDLWRNGVKFTTANTNVAPTTAAPIRYGVANGAGTAAATTSYYRGSFITSSALTDAQMDLLSRAMQSLYNGIAYGDVMISEAGYGPATVTADVIVYGWTWQGVMAAYEAKRQGRSVALVGGWDDHTPQHIGGVSANGLGQNDVDSSTAFGGLTRVTLARIAAMGFGSGLVFEPKGMNFVLRQMLDPARASIGQDVPLYESNGVLSAAKTGTTINSITCADGRTYSGTVFIDASYEGDLLAAAGASFIIGIEAAGTGSEVLNGYRDGASASTIGGTNIRIDPFVTPGDSASGLIANVVTNPAKTIGVADTTTQAFGLRQTWVNSPRRRIAFPSTPRAGYDPSQFEVLGRLFAGATAASKVVAITDVMIVNTLPNQVFDVNSKGIMSFDLLGSGTAYTALTTYAQRRAYKTVMQNYTSDLIYYLTYDPDSRIHAGVRTALLAYGYDAYHYLDPGPDDITYRTSTIYVREHRRLIGDIVWDANDLAATDGGTPRSTKTASVASYALDSHPHRRIANFVGGVWATHIQGSLGQSNANGANLQSPLPREIFLSKQSEAINLGVAFAISTTHTAFGSCRMEDATAQAAQSLAMLAAMAIEGGTTMAAVDDAAFRARMFATPEQATYAVNLPQVN